MSFSVNNNNSPANPYTQAESTQGFTVSDVFKFVNDAVMRAKQDLNQAPSSTTSLKQINATVLSPSYTRDIPCESDTNCLITQALVFGGLFAACVATVMILKYTNTPRKNSLQDSAQV